MQGKKTVNTAHKELLTLEGAVDNMTLWDGMQGKGTVVLTVTWLHPFEELNFNQNCQIWINWIFKKNAFLWKKFQRQTLIDTKRNMLQNARTKRQEHFKKHNSVAPWQQNIGNERWFKTFPQHYMSHKATVKQQNTLRNGYPMRIFSHITYHLSSCLMYQYDKYVTGDCRYSLLFLSLDLLWNYIYLITNKPSK